ncbi:hypothetical protein GCM10029992_59010 [Glycomyces albus]
MRAVIIAAFVAFALTMALTPVAATAFRRLKAGQPIRTDGPQTHLAKTGTPTMGGVVFIFATVVAYIVGHLVLMALPEGETEAFSRPTNFTATGLVLIGLFVLCGFVGFIDDWLKLRRKNSGGISGKAKILGLTIAAIAVGLVAVYYTGSIDSADISETVATPYLSFTQDIEWLYIGQIGAVVLFVFIVNATANGVNLTDGLDGLATGASMLAFVAYLIIGFWQYRHWCGGAGENLSPSYCYDVRDPSRSPSSPGPPPAPCSASCGGTRTRPRSSWATPARSASAASSAASPWPPRRSCCCRSSAACSSSSPSA